MPSPLDQPETTPGAKVLDSSSSTGRAPTSEVATPQALAIEYPGSDIATEKEVEEVHTLDVGGGNVVKLDRLGPMIVNSDGTLSRIQNWHELSELEQERTVRLLVKKRNLVRLERLDQAEKAEGRTDGEQLSALADGKEGGR